MSEIFDHIFSIFSAMPAMFHYIVLFLFGSLTGSFINVCIYRMPRQQSIVFPASNCPKCNTPIKPYDNIPILSWLILGGKCRSCKKPISIQYPIVEALTALTFMLVFYRVGLSIQLPVYLFFAIYLLIAALTDLFTFFYPPRTTIPVKLVLPKIIISSDEPPPTKSDLVWEGVIYDETYKHKNPKSERIGIGQQIKDATLPKVFVKPIVIEKGIIPDEISIGGMVIGLFLALISEVSAVNLTIFPENPLVEAVIGFFAGAGSLYSVSAVYKLIRKKEGMGLGDVKLLGMIGIFLGWKSILITIFVGSLVGVLATIPYVVMSKMGRESPLPFGPSLAVGALLAFAISESFIFF